MLLTPIQVADRLQVARVTVYRLMKSGDLPWIRLGGNSRRVAESDLNAFIASRRVA